MGSPTVLFCLDEPNIDLQLNIHHSIRETYTFPQKKHIYISSLSIISELVVHFSPYQIVSMDFSHY